MSAVKERLIGAITIMTENEALLLWEDLKNSYTQRNNLSEVEETEPTDEEIKILDAFENGDPDYAPDTSIEDLKNELGLD